MLRRRPTRPPPPDPVVHPLPPQHGPVTVGAPSSGDDFRVWRPNPASFHKLASRHSPLLCSPIPCTGTTSILVNACCDGQRRQPAVVFPWVASDLRRESIINVQEEGFLLCLSMEFLLKTMLNQKARAPFCWGFQCRNW